MRSIAILLSAAFFAASALAADVTGRWDLIAKTSGGREYRLELSLSGDPGSLKGVLSSEQGSVDLQEVKLAGSDLSFKFSVGDGGYQVKLTVDGDTMKGKYSSDQGSGGEVNATRTQ